MGLPSQSESVTLFLREFLRIEGIRNQEEFRIHVKQQSVEVLSQEHEGSVGFLVHLLPLNECKLEKQLQNLMDNWNSYQSKFERNNFPQCFETFNSSGFVMKHFCYRREKCEIDYICCSY